MRRIVILAVFSLAACQSCFMKEAKPKAEYISTDCKVLTCDQAGTCVCHD